VRRRGGICVDVVSFRGQFYTVICGDVCRRRACRRRCVDVVARLRVNYSTVVVVVVVVVVFVVALNDAAVFFFS